MQYEYDSWNRIQEMTYPDGERVRYGYNLGGMLSRVTGQKDDRSYHYIDSIHYNRFELKEGVWYGNGTRVTYDYDSLQRLSRLQSACADGAMQDIAYTYDSVGNILRIENGAGTLSNGLGGTYSDTYTYDNLYRLSFAEGSWLGNHSLQYETASEYEKNGRIAWKSLSASTWLNGHLATELYSNEYHYNNPGQPNTLSDINEESGQQFEWDALGNMTRHVQSTTDRRLCWDEQNRLQGVKDNRYLSYYQYDAGGDRTYKLTGKGELQNISGNWQYYYLLDNATLYASPYLVATDRGYTKHYYAESERIASRIGGGGMGDALGSGDGNEELLVTHQAHFAEHFDAVMDCLGADAQPAEDLLKSLYNWLDSVQDEKDCYWYHPDHLGSSSWITFSDGSAVQHLHYLPWGEDFVNQRTSPFSSRYTFSAKEKDTETGYSYFGSRYYSSDLSVWLSVDPMADKYPSMSPYVYCADNPVRCVDPNGEDIWEINYETSEVTRTTDRTKDVIRIVDNDGNVVSDKDGNPQSLTYNYGTIKHYKTKKNGYDIFTVRGDNIGTAIFELAAKNTNVEWSQFKTGHEGDRGLNFITTGHTDEGDPAATNLYNKQLQYKYYIREFIHYHPGRMPVPSGMLGTIQEGTGDISFVSKINRNNIRFGYKIPTYKIFAKGFGYNEYNANSQVPDFECIYDLYGRRPRMKE